SRGSATRAPRRARIGEEKSAQIAGISLLRGQPHAFMLWTYGPRAKGDGAMTATRRRSGDKRPKALALPRGGFAGRAEEELYEAGWHGGGEEAGGHYDITPVRVGRLMLPAIRSVNDDREVLGEIAKQLVIAGIPFRLVTVR
ncbi:MAG: hypothetical protein ACYTKD_30620, partial [Planctomycetota bacterium]